MPKTSNWVGWIIAGFAAAIGFGFTMIADMEDDWWNAYRHRAGIIARVEQDVAVNREKIKMLLEEQLDRRIKSGCRDAIDAHRVSDH
tara:strand:- start:185 stop:445 length:261 start_codon:yes stop_codon:yes gene_type:complete